MRRMPAAMADFAHDAEQADLARGARVRAAAKLHRVAVQRCRPAADLHHAHAVAVFLAEELHDVRARLHVGVADLGPGHGGVFEDALVDEALDVGHLLRRERRAAEVEGELVGADVGALLRGVPADDLVQRPVQQMRDGVVALDGLAAGAVHGEADSGAVAERVRGAILCRSPARKCSQASPAFWVLTMSPEFGRRRSSRRCRRPGRPSRRKAARRRG